MKIIFSSLVACVGFGLGTFLVLRDKNGFAAFVILLAFILAILILKDSRPTETDSAGKAQRKSVEAE